MLCVALGGLGLSGAGCGRRSLAGRLGEQPSLSRSAPEPHRPESNPDTKSSLTSVESSPTPQGGQDPEPHMLVTDPEVLAALEETGLSFARRVLDRPHGSLADLGDAPRMRDLIAILERDLARVRRMDPRAGVGMRFAHRLFDVDWLRSSRARFVLVGVVNRLDRAVFAPEHCGEVRLVYRLAYQSDKVASRLPMTLNLVYFQPRSSQAARGAECHEAARRWQHAAQGRALSEALRGPYGPLQERLLSEAQLKSLELDVQTVRWPSTIRPDMGGHAEYALRVLVPAGAGWKAAPLENTPRADLSRAERAELRSWILANLEAIDAGTALMPQAFADTVSTSVTPLGLGRLANRPFGRLFEASEFSELELARFSNIASPDALLRRLDGMSCAGCHQTRSAAGFHLLGEDPPDQALDALAVPGSPHLMGELPRRLAYARALLAGDVPDPSRPHSDHEPSAGGFGAHCSLGDPGLRGFQCGPGLRCERHGDPVMGTCVPIEPGGAGAPCEVGALKPHRDATRDRVQNLSLRECGRGVCNDNRVGFPQGMCTPGCDALAPGEACGSIVALRPFNDCIARGEAFTDCITRAASPAGLRACSAEVGCRDDYLCARGRSGEGVCIPPYFLFQLRVDGHVVPR